MRPPLGFAKSLQAMPPVLIAKRYPMVNATENMRRMLAFARVAATQKVNAGPTAPSDVTERQAFIEFFSKRRLTLGILPKGLFACVQTH